jgi:hypothetical protein
MIEDRLRRPGRLLQISFLRRCHLRPAFGLQRCVPSIVPEAGTDQIAQQPLQRIPFPGRGHLRLVPIAAGIIRSGVICEPVGEAFHQPRPAAGPGGLKGGIDHVCYRQHVVAVDLFATESRRYSLLGQGPGRRLLPAWRRYGPLIVAHHEYHREPPQPRHVHGFVNVTLGGSPVAEQADCRAGFSTQLESQRDPGGMRRMTTHGDADRKILPGAGEVGSALVTAPVKQQLIGADAAAELSGVVPE